MKVQIPGFCDNCRKETDPLLLYVVPGNMEYLFYCEHCFDQIKVEDYYRKIRDELIHDIYPESVYTYHKNDTLVIAFSRGAALDPEAILPGDFKRRIVEEVEKEFMNRKILNKFSIISHKSVLKQHDKYYYEVRCTAKVKHKSYKQFLEHELYNYMRKELDLRVIN